MSKRSSSASDESEWLRDRDWVQRAVARDPAAEEWLAIRLKRVPRLVAGYAKRLAWVKPSDLPDLSSEVVVAVLGRLGEFRGHCPFDAWVSLFCKNTVLAHSRRARRARMPTLEFDPMEERETPDVALAAREEEQRVIEALGRLGGAEGEIVRQRLLEGRDFRSISEEQGIPMAALRTRYYRALQRLRDHLSRKDSGEARA